METSTYLSEIVASRIATELILEVWFMFLLLGISLGGPTLMIRDKILVLLNTSVPSSIFK
jgi:hypothetical protein